MSARDHGGAEIPRSKVKEHPVQEIVEWLEGVERLAAGMYKEGANAFAGDETFAAFLCRLSEDEAEHALMMQTVAEELARKGIRLGAAISVGEVVREGIERPVRETCKLLSAGDLPKGKLIERMVTTESAELNDIFLYAVTTARTHVRAAQHMAAAIEAHKERIQRFIDDLPTEFRPAKDLRALPRIWERRLLVVDDDAATVELIARLLGKEMIVETAGNGEEGLAKAKDQFCDLVLSDIEMPVKDGIAFYEELVEAAPEMRDHFLFWTGAMNAEREAFLKANDLECLAKPHELGELVEKIRERILGRE